MNYLDHKASFILENRKIIYQQIYLLAILYAQGSNER